MKHKRILPFLMLFTLTSCNFFGEPKTPDPPKPIIIGHVHTFSSNWSNDEEYHWHAATCEHTNEVSYKGAHKFSDWDLIVEATSLESGVRERTCSTCGYTQSEIIDPLERDGLSAESAFTVPELIDRCKYLNTNEFSSREYFVCGKVKNCTYSSEYSSYSFYFDGYESLENGASAYVYSAIIDSNSGLHITSTRDLEGKNVIIHGYLNKYYKVGESIKYELSYVSKKDSFDGKAHSPTIVDVFEGDIVVHNHTYSSEWSSDNNYHWHAATCEHSNLSKDKRNHTFNEWTIIKEATKTAEGEKYRICSTCGYVEYKEIAKLDSNNGSFTIYTFNDFHGAVTEQSNLKHIGLAKLGTYFKKVSSEENVLIIDSGDTFQGSIESNHNNGALITDVFNYSHVDVHTLGNHDFDWGQDKIESNKSKTGTDGFKTAYLGGNVYDYNFDTKTQGRVQQDRLGDTYFVKTLDSGIKIGVIGVIGSEQITSICSPLVEDICFTNHINVIKEVSDKLRTEEHVSAVIASVHNGASYTYNHGLADISPVSGKRYVDYVACGHSHQVECLNENGVYYTQAAAYGEYVYKASFDIESGNVTCKDVELFDYYDLNREVTSVDPTISSIIGEYEKDYKSIGSKVVAKSVSGTFGRYEEACNLLAKSMYETANLQGYNVNYALTNQARYNLTGSSWTYSQLYEAFPFDNLIYIVKVKGRKNIEQLVDEHNSIYRDENLTRLNANTWYTLAVIDYSLFHTNILREYDYFDHSSSNMQVLGILKDSHGNNYLYRDIMADYVSGLTDTIYSRNYSSSGRFSYPSI